MTAWGEVIDGQKVYPLHAGQAAVMRSRARITGAFAGTGGGKSAVGALWSLRQIQRLIDKGDKPPVPFMVIGPTWDILNRNSIPMFCDVLAGTPLAGTYVSSKHLYRLANGWNVHFLSGHKSDNIEGGQTGGAWVDEAGQLPYRTWLAIKGRCGLRRAPVLLTTTLYRLNWCKREIIKQWKAKDRNYKVVNFASILNPTYSREEFEEAKRTLSPALFSMRYLGEFPPDSSLVFHDFDETQHVQPDEFRPDDIIHVGCSFASNPAIMLCARQAGGGVLHVLKEIVIPNASTHTMLNALLQSFDGERRFAFYGDAPAHSPRGTAAASDYQLIDHDRRFLGSQICMPYRQLAIADRVASTNARFRAHKLFVNETCGGLVEELESRFNLDDWREPKKPEEENDPGPISDALTFIVNWLYPLDAIEKMVIHTRSKHRRRRKRMMVHA